jgi:beta-lactamase regulating signal transducer with metallopeptidase domain
MLLTILQIAASNAISAVILAGLVFAVSLIVRRPALVRALWVLVLLKLLTPPLWVFPIDDYIARVLHRPAVLNNQVTPEFRATESDDGERIRIPSDAQLVEDPTPISDASAEQAISLLARNDEPVAKAVPVAETLAGAWGAGSAWCLILAVLRVGRFRRCLRLAEAAPATIGQRCAALAKRVGISRSPSVLFVPSAVCPSIWAFSRPARIVIPRQLWDRLDAIQQDALLMHELAHLRRRDHWVRLLEVAATIVYWWHPLVWLARRQLHEAEEQCCDAWVIGLLGAERGRYAEALLETVDFLSLPHPATPALASGLGEFSRLKRRIVMIQCGRVRKALSWSGAIVVFALACLVLPVAAGFGQDSPDQEKKAENQLDRAATDKQDFQRVLILQSTVDTARDENAEAAKLERATAIKEARQEVERLCAESDKIQAQISQAKERWRALEAAQPGRDEPSLKLDDTKAAKKLDEIKSGKLDERKTAARNRDFIRWSVISRADASPDERLDRLEKQVKSILAEIEELRSQRHEAPKP